MICCASGRGRCSEFSTAWITRNGTRRKIRFSGILIRSRNLAGKALNKAELQKELGLPVDADTPLFGSITRLADQKGVDIQLGALEEMLSTKMQFVLLGSGSPVYEQAYRELARRYPAKVAVRIGFDQGLSHRIEAGCDFYLMPSRFEPCGLNQMYSLRYGTIPIVRITGGLDDTVVDISEDRDKADGIKFAEYSARALAKSMRKALVLYGEAKVVAALPAQRHDGGFLLGPHGEAVFGGLQRAWSLTGRTEALNFAAPLPMRNHRRNLKRGVTLTELMCVLAIIAILLALYLPTIARAFKRVKHFLLGT